MKTSIYLNRDKEQTAHDLLYSILNWINHDKTVEEVCTKHRKIKVTIEKAESQRSIAANNFYWGIIIPGFQKPEVWPDYTKDMVHETLSEAFRTIRKPQEMIDREIAENRHKTRWYVKSTTKDNTFEFWEYCEKCTNALFEAGGSLDIDEQRTYKEVQGMYK